MLGKYLKVAYKPITKITNYQLGIKLELLTQEELDVVQTKIIIRKAAGHDEIASELWKMRNVDDLMLRYCKAVNQNTIKRWIKGCILPFPKKCYLRFANNYWDITLNFLATEIYNVLLLNRIELGVEKNENGFRRNCSTISQILTIHRI